MMDTRGLCVLFGGTGTIGRATLPALVEAGHNVRLVVRNADRGRQLARDMAGVDVVEADVTDGSALPRLMDGAEAVVSCLASRTGTPKDAYAIDRDAHLGILTAAQSAGVQQFVLLSAICVQKPLLPFQQAKLEFEAALRASGLTWSIVRPTAFFKSLVGQVARVKAGKPYLVFGDGTLTRAMPISDRDLGRYIVSCLTDPDLQNRVLPIGGPGGALSPRDIGTHIFARLGREERFKCVPPGLLATIGSALRMAGLIVPSLRDKAEMARIGHYYGTESMLVWTGQNYDAEATPTFGSDVFLDYLDAVIDGRAEAERGEHAVF